MNIWVSHNYNIMKERVKAQKSFPDHFFVRHLSVCKQHIVKENHSPMVSTKLYRDILDLLHIQECKGMKKT